jgi:capsular exopolysaccharide synthesis family protein
LARVVRRTDTPNLHVLTAGTTPPNPSELLGSRRFNDFLIQFGTEYDWIILDSPPVMPVTDSLVLCGKVTGVLVVAAAELTPLPALRGMLEQLARSPAQIIGAVLNRVDLDRRSYYYSQYYSPDYGRYYTQSTMASYLRPFSRTLHR